MINRHTERVRKTDSEIGRETQRRDRKRDG